MNVINNSLWHTKVKVNSNLQELKPQNTLLKGRVPFSGSASIPLELKTTPAMLAIEDIPKLAFLGRINYTDKTKHITSTIDPKEIKRAVIVNDQDFTSLQKLSNRYIDGIHPGVSLRTDDFIVKDTKIPVLVTTKTGDLIFPVDSLEFDQVNALVHAKETANMIDNYLGVKVPWAFEGPVELDAHARFYNYGTGEYCETWDNAFYDRAGKTISLLIAENKREKGVVYASRSSDTIAHETSHAKLDGLERYLGDSKCFITVGIHEAFSDFNAIIHSLFSDNVIDNVLETTKGDLRKDNMASQFDIQFGRMVLAQEKPCLRSAINNLKRPENIGDLNFIPDDFDNKLGIEPHFYSRLFTGTLYDLLVLNYEKNLKDFDNNQKFALVKARDTIGSMFNRSFLYVPTGEINFKDVAKAMLSVDQIENQGANKDILIKVFKDRNILKDNEIKVYESMPDLSRKIKLPSDQPSDVDLLKLLNTNKEKLGLSKEKNYSVHRTFVDSNGNTFVKFTNDLELKIPDDKNIYFNMAGDKIPMTEGITLVFNKEGSLISALNKEITSEDKQDFLKIFQKYADFKYKPLQEAYDEIGDEWEAELKRREEDRRKRKTEEPDAPKPPKSTIHRYIF